jgi:hypothetical protein
MTTHEVRELLGMGWNVWVVSWAVPSAQAFVLMVSRKEVLLSLSCIDRLALPFGEDVELMGPFMVPFFTNPFESGAIYLKGPAR